MDEPNSYMRPGAMVGEYEIVAKIGEGGFGTVYSAIHPVIGKHAAIKVLSRRCSHSAEHLSRFKAEARAVNQIQHRNIIDIFLFGETDDGRQYYVMELLDGMPLLDYLEERGWLEPTEALPLLRDIARALDAAHAAGIAHRDLKPENVFLAYDADGTTYPVLLDFGIAKLMDHKVRHRTVTGAALGTPMYMSPEQWRNDGVDHRTDIYALGVLTHELLTGQLPFDDDNRVDLMMAHSHKAPPLVSQRAALPVDIDAPIAHMLAKDPADRPASAGEAIRALLDAAGHAPAPAIIDTSDVSVTGIATTTAVEPPRPTGSHWVVAAAMLAMGIGAASLAASEEPPLRASAAAISAPTIAVPPLETSAEPSAAPAPTSRQEKPVLAAPPPVKRIIAHPRPKPSAMKTVSVPDDIENPFD